MALGSPIFPWSCEGKLGVLLESLQGQRDLIEACVQDLIFLSREDRDLGFPFQTPLGSQASPRGEAEDSAFLSSRDTDLLEPNEWTQGCRASSSVWREDSGLLSRPDRKRRPHLAMTGASHGFPQAVAPVGVFSRGTMRTSGSLSCGARELMSPCAWRGGAGHHSRVMGND